MSTHPNAGTRTLETIASAPDERAASRAIGRLTDSAALTRLIGTGHPFVLRELARHPHLPADSVLALTAHRAARVHRAAALHPACPPDIAVRLVGNLSAKELFGPDPFLQRCALPVAVEAQPVLLSPWAQAAIQAGRTDLLAIIGEHPRSYDDLACRELLLNHLHKPVIRTAVFGNPYWPRETQRPWDTPKGPVLDAHAIAAMNDPSQHTRAAGWESATVSRTLVTDPHVPDDALKILTGHPRSDIRLRAQIRLSGTFALPLLKDSYQVQNAGALLGPDWHASPEREHTSEGLVPSDVRAEIGDYLDAARAADPLQVFRRVLFLLRIKGVRHGLRYLPDVFAAGHIDLDRAREIVDSELRTAEGLEQVLEGVPLEWALAWEDGQT